MPPQSRLQFALVREDPALELGLLPPPRPDRRPAVLLVASGGCTALTLARARPDVALSLIDANPAQLEHVRAKWAALEGCAPGSEARRRAFGVDADAPESLSGSGNFEALFRGLRGVLDDLALGAEDRRAVLRGERPVEALTSSPWWPVAFELFFSDVFLETMFGPDATQHAARGSYPGYFRRAIERGLARPDRATNGWLHQVLLGHWLPGAEPDFLSRAAPDRPPNEWWYVAPMAEGPSFDRFDLVSLSNLFDWMDADGVAAIARRLEAECRPGAVVLIRQLNNRAPVEAMLPSFDFDPAEGEALARADRSLFYERVLVGRRRARTLEEDRR